MPVGILFGNFFIAGAKAGEKFGRRLSVGKRKDGVG